MIGNGGQIGNDGGGFGLGTVVLWLDLAGVVAISRLDLADTSSSGLRARSGLGARSPRRELRDDDDDDDDNYEEKREDNYNYPPPGRNTIPAFDDQPPPPPRPHSYYQEDELPPPPRPHSYYQEDELPPPPPTHLSHTHHAPPPPQEYGYSAYPSESAPPPPIYSSSTHVEHVAYDVNPSEVEAETHHSHRPHLPSFLHHQTPQNPTSDLYNKPTYKIFSKAEPNFSLTNRDGHVILAPSDPSDEFQHWYKDEKYSTRVKDEEGFPCFALVNKATGQAIKHSIGASHPVQLIPYNADVLDESILWTQGKDLGDGFRTYCGNGTKGITSDGRSSPTDLLAVLLPCP
ncbi:hypothetical protein CMV_005785 [Castanea mollissima]|uniref:Uncharacterized protein n=1 Tax=Castanea mollissima TaxID=60419 RepID=A0A8J4RBY7_9ROSI|nr:hypothetical protein CMV_005785 [Castanea mollissima]